MRCGPGLVRMDLLYKENKEIEINMPGIWLKTISPRIMAETPVYNLINPTIAINPSPFIDTKMQRFAVLTSTITVKYKENENSILCSCCQIDCSGNFPLTQF